MFTKRPSQSTWPLFLGDRKPDRTTHELLEVDQNQQILTEEEKNCKNFLKHQYLWLGYVLTAFFFFLPHLKMTVWRFSLVVISFKLHASVTSFKSRQLHN